MEKINIVFERSKILGKIIASGKFEANIVTRCLFHTLQIQYSEIKLNVIVRIFVQTKIFTNIILKKQNLNL